MGKSSTLTYVLQARIDKLEQGLNRANQRMSAFNRRTAAISSQIQSHLSAAFSVYAVVAFGKAQFELIKQLDSTNKALMAVAGSGEEFDRVKKMLSQTARDYGVDLLDLTSAYTKFTASTKSSKLSSEELDSVFKSIAKSSAVLGLSAEQTEGAFRAVEQMFSKGTIQAEEIRGQLSERLPGAFNILAKSMGITTEELGKQLKLGKVLADDVMPNFAKALEEAYGADKVEMVDTLTGAQNRLGNAWTEFVESIENGEGTISKSLKSIFNGISSILDFFSKGEFWKDFTQSGMEAFTVSEKLFKNLADPRLDAKKWTKVYISDLDDALEKVSKSTGDMTETMRMDFEVLQKKLAKYGESLIQLQNPTSRQKEEIIRLSKAMKTLDDVLKRETQSEREAREALEAAAEARKKSAEAINEETEALENRRKIPNVPTLSPITSFDLGGIEMPDIGIQMSPIVEEYQRFQEELRLRQLAILEDQNAFINQFSTSLISGFTQGLVDGGLASAFDNILKIIGDGLIQIGESLVAYGIGMEALKKALNNPFGAGIGSVAAGIAMIAAGTALKGAVSGSNKNTSSRLGGGGGGGSFQGSQVTGQSMGVQDYKFRVEGQDLVLVLNTYANKNARNQLPVGGVR